MADGYSEKSTEEAQLVATHRARRVHGCFYAYLVCTDSSRYKYSWRRSVYVLIPLGEHVHAAQDAGLFIFFNSFDLHRIWEIEISTGS